MKKNRKKLKDSREWEGAKCALEFALSSEADGTVKDRVSDEEQETEEGRRRDGEREREREREKDGRKERRDIFKDVVASRQALKAGDRRPPPPLSGISS